MSKETGRTLAGKGNAALSYEHTVWFLVSPFLCTKSGYEKKSPI